MMNSSAKITLTLIATAALGAVAFACSVSSGTVDDVDGGTNTSSSSSGATTSSSGTVDSGTDGNTNPTCPQNTYASAIESEECQTCLDTSCCAEFSACWNRAANEGDSLGCDAYQEQLSGCDDAAGTSDPDECKSLTKTVAAEGIPAAYDGYLSCRNTKCDTACNAVRVSADAGSK